MCWKTSFNARSDILSPKSFGSVYCITLRIHQYTHKTSSFPDLEVCRRCLPADRRKLTSRFNTRPKAIQVYGILAVPENIRVVRKTLASKSLSIISLLRASCGIKRHQQWIYLSIVYTHRSGVHCLKTSLYRVGWRIL